MKTFLAIIGGIFLLFIGIFVIGLILYNIGVDGIEETESEDRTIKTEPKQQEQSTRERRPRTEMIERYAGYAVENRIERNLPPRFTSAFIYSVRLIDSDIYNVIIEARCYYDCPNGRDSQSIFYEANAKYLGGPVERFGSSWSITDIKRRN